MVTILKHGRLLSQSLAALLLLLGLWQFCATVSRVATYAIDCDATLAPVIKQAMHDVISSEISSFGPQLYQKLKVEFPFVQSLEMRAVGLNKVYVRVIAPDLIWQVGDHFVLTRAGDIQLASCFDQVVVQSLPKINLAINPKFASDVASELRQFLLELPEEIRSEFILDWDGPNRIMLTNRQNLTQKILIRFDQLLTLGLLQACQQLFLKYDQQAKKPCRGTVQADVRFAGQIVVSC